MLPSRGNKQRYRMVLSMLSLAAKEYQAHCHSLCCLWRQRSGIAVLFLYLVCTMHLRCFFSPSRDGSSAWLSHVRCGSDTELYLSHLVALEASWGGKFSVKRTMGITTAATLYRRPFVSVSNFPFSLTCVSCYLELAAKCGLKRQSLGCIRTSKVSIALPTLPLGSSTDVTPLDAAVPKIARATPSAATSTLILA